MLPKIFPPQHRQLLQNLINCTQNKDILKGRTLHARILKDGSLSSIYVANTLFNLYAKSGYLSHAFILFDSINDNQKDVVSWNSLINAYSQYHSPSSYSFAINLFRRMMGTNNVVPNAHTLAGVFSAASNLSDVLSGDSDKALKLFNSMHSSGVLPSEFTLVGAINACSDLCAVDVISLLSVAINPFRCCPVFYAGSLAIRRSSPTNKEGNWQANGMNYSQQSKISSL
ncbi:hypothetical protein TSUD_106840 [Trifolium subterraneum]|uniref:Pentatricopeptide repeat-containing protein n=1 Tax=Trifolium subterraneum TaxID=3900 RepID=A0A2Z6LU72_TRISU|nr:hypothetical protein TSUD_106840 [Trifolium subterraneum]